MSFYTPHDRVTIDCSDMPSMTKQEFKDECDINTILKQFTLTGMIDHINSSPAQWLDLPDVTDYQASLALVADAAEAFASLPSKVRDEFGNDPARFLDAFGDPAKADRLRELGLLNPLPASPSPGSPAAPVGGEPPTPAGGA